MPSSPTGGTCKIIALHFNIKCSSSSNKKIMNETGRLSIVICKWGVMILFVFIDKFLSPELRSLAQECAAEFQSATLSFSIRRLWSVCKWAASPPPALWRRVGMRSAQPRSSPSSTQFLKTKFQFNSFKVEIIFKKLIELKWMKKRRWFDWLRDCPRNSCFVSPAGQRCDGSDIVLCRSWGVPHAPAAIQASTVPDFQCRRPFVNLKFKWTAPSSLLFNKTKKNFNYWMTLSF